MVFFPPFGQGMHEKNPTGDVFDQPFCEKSLIRTKLADHIEDHVVLSPGGVVRTKSSGTESSNPLVTNRSLNDSQKKVRVCVCPKAPSTK